MASLFYTIQSATRRFSVSIGAMLTIVLLCDRALPDDGLAYCLDDYVQNPQAAELWRDWSDPGDRFWSEPPGPLVVNIDYRALTMFGSHTSYQFGTPPQLGGPQYAPMSKLVFPINSCWNGFRLGVQAADSAAHFEWLTPMGPRINGDLEDFDWNINNPRDDPTRLDSLSRSSERWNEGQMLNIEYEFRLLKRLLGLPVEVWPTLGYRWQRFSIRDFDGVQVIPPDGPFPPPFDGTLIAFKQEYSIGYIGAQVRGRLDSGILPPIALTLQGDWGYTQANNIDHHQYYEYFGIYRFTGDDTHGDAMHFALTAEALFCRDRLSIGCQADYMEITTTGRHRWIYYDNITLIDETWTNGVKVSSRQMSITAFIRLRF